MKKNKLYESPSYLKRKANEPDQFRRYQKQIRKGLSGRKNRALRGWARKILAKVRRAAYKAGFDPKEGRAFFVLYGGKFAEIHAAAGVMNMTVFRKNIPCFLKKET